MSGDLTLHLTFGWSSPHSAGGPWICAVFHQGIISQVPSRVLTKAKASGTSPNLSWLSWHSLAKSTHRYSDSFLEAGPVLFKIMLRTAQEKGNVLWHSQHSLEALPSHHLSGDFLWQPVPPASSSILTSLRGCWECGSFVYQPHCS